MALDRTKSFMKYHWRSEQYRSSLARTRDWSKLSMELDEDELKYQTVRCTNPQIQPTCPLHTTC
jgi:glutamate synthase (NADH)